MLFYIAILAILIIFALFEQFNKEKDISILKWQVCLILILFAALRPAGIDKDYENYVGSFISFDSPSEYFSHFNDLSFFEPVYYLLPAFLKEYISSSSYVFITFLLFALAGVVIKFIAFNRLTNDFFLATLTYFCYYFLLHEMTQIRAGVASGLLLMMIYYLKELKHVAAIVMLLIAVTVHYSSLIFIVVFFLHTEKPRLWLYYTLLTIVLFLSFSNFSFLKGFEYIDLGPLSLKANTYTQLTEGGEFMTVNRHNVFFLLIFLNSVICLWQYQKISSENKYALLLLKTQIWGLFFFQLLASVPPIAFRISEVLIITSIINFTNYKIVFKNPLMGFGIVTVTAVIFFIINLFFQQLLKPYSIDSLLSF